MKGDNTNLENIYCNFFPKIYNYIFYRLLHRETTEDLVSQIFLKVAEHIGDYNSEKASIGTWIWTIAENTLKDFYRTQKTFVSLDEVNSINNRLSICFEDQYELIISQKRRALYKALSCLSERDRIIIYYKYFCQMSYKEVSEKLNIKESTLSTVSMRAKEKLRPLLRKELDNSFI